MEKEVYYYNCFGSISGNIKMTINLDIPRELTDKDNQIIQKFASEIIEGINRETLSNKSDIKLKAKEEKEKLIALFGDKKIYVKEIENGYFPEDGYYSQFKWLLVTTEKGVIKIGWRKRVIEIDWTDSDIFDSANVLFPDEDVTKGDRFIHAWGYEKAQEYLNTLLS